MAGRTTRDVEGQKSTYPWVRAIDGKEPEGGSRANVLVLDLDASSVAMPTWKKSINFL